MIPVADLEIREGGGRGGGGAEGASPRSTIRPTGIKTTTKMLRLLFNIIINSQSLFPLVNTRLSACVPTAFLALLNFHLWFYTGSIKI